MGISAPNLYSDGNVSNFLILFKSDVFIVFDEIKTPSLSFRLISLIFSSIFVYTDESSLS